MGPIDLAALRAERERRRAHHMLGHLRTEAYPAYRNAIYPAGQAKITIEGNDASLRKGREALERIAKNKRK